MSITYLANSDLTTLSAALVRALPAFDADEQRLAVELYRELATGEPVSAS